MKRVAFFFFFHPEKNYGLVSRKLLKLKMHQPSPKGLPMFQIHHNSPSAICEQILLLVKNSNLNFELKETPFSFNLNLKKTLAQHREKENIYKKTFPNPVLNQSEADVCPSFQNSQKKTPQAEIIKILVTSFHN